MIYSRDFLIGGFNPLKNMKVKWDDSSQYNPIYGKKNVPNHQSDHHNIPIVVGL
jgi:hypothetical protein